MSRALHHFMVLAASILVNCVILGSLYANPINVNIGIYAPFSTKSAFIGRNIQAGLELGRDNLKTSGPEYSLYTLDVPSNSKNAASILQKFIDVHHINVLLTEGSANGLMAAPIAQKSNIIHFSMASDPAIADGKNNFLAWSPAEEQAQVLVNQLKIKKIHQLGIITTNHPAINALTESVVKQLHRSNAAIKITSYDQFNSGTQDFSALMQRIKKTDPDLYLVMASPENIELLQQAMITAEINKPITTIVERVTPKIMTIFKGQWYVDTHEMKPEFINHYKEAYLNHPVTEAGYAFDVFQILNSSINAALKKDKQYSTEAVARQIQNIASGSGVMGPFTFDKNGILYTKSDVKLIKNGQIVTA